MKHFLFLSLVLVCGCSGKIPQEEKSNFDTQTGIVHSDAPVVIEARIVGGGYGNKYYYYDIEPTKVIKNSIEANLDSRIKVARVNYESQPELNKTYTLELGYYNEAHPEYGLKIIRFKEK